MLRCRTMCQFLVVIITAGLSHPLSAQANKDPNRSRANLILLKDEIHNIDSGTTVLELARKRLPLVVEIGRFSTEDGMASTCVYSRRNSARMLRAGADPMSRSCEMIAAFVDGIRISNAASYLESTPANTLESIELIRASDANFRYGMSANGGEALEVWTRGRGPHARGQL